LGKSAQIPQRGLEGAQLPFKLVSALLAHCLAALAIALLTPAATLASATGAGCPNHASPGFRSYLPDCRAYELVTPAYKEAMAVNSNGGLSHDGTRLIMRSYGSFAGVDSAPIGGAIYMANRASTGWHTTPLEAPLIATYPRFDGNASSYDLTRNLWAPTFPDQAAEDIYVHEGDGTFIRVGPGGPPGAIEPRLNFVGASGDLSHLVFNDRAPLSVDSEVRLWSGDATRGEGQLSLYEYVGSGNVEPQLVGVSNEGVVAKIGESRLISQCATIFGSPEGDVYNAISQSGSTVFFTAMGFDAGRACQEPSVEVEPAVNELYARVDASHTVAISEATSKDCGACVTTSPADALFRGASLDGSRVFFTTRQHLLLDAEGEGEDLYEYDFEAPEGKRVTLVSSGDAAGARVQGVARVSKDGSHVYFVAQGVLTGKEVNAYGQEAREGDENLYVSIQECPSGGGSCPEPRQRLSFIGRLSAADSQDWAGSDQRPVQATPNGRFLVFQSAADLTPDDTSTVQQAFEYDAQTGSLVRVSRGVGGYNEDGNSSIYPATISSLAYNEINHPESRFVAVSADGSYVFFTSADGLSPGTVIGQRSVYEYHAGEVSLISDGHDLFEAGSTLLGTDESGQDVFFASGDPLVPQDADTQEDVYDARIAGGFPAPLASPACSEDACQGPLAGALQPQAPATSFSEGEGAVPAVSSGPAKVTATPKRKSQTKTKKRKRKRTHGARRAARSRK
jgi:hypothetical protein